MSRRTVVQRKRHSFQTHRLDLSRAKRSHRTHPVSHDLPIKTASHRPDPGIVIVQICTPLTNQALEQFGFSVGNLADGIKKTQGGRGLHW